MVTGDVVPARARFAVGDDVLVPWGLDDFRGRVVSSRSVDGDAIVDVAVTFPDSDEPETVAVPASRLRSVSDPERPERAVGSWFDAYNEKRRLGAALSRVLQGPHAVESITADTVLAEGEIDLLLHLVNGTSVVVDVKHGPTPHVDRAVSRVEELLRARNDPSWVGALVLLRATPDDTLVQPQGVPVAVAVWRGDEDDENLRTALARLVGPLA